MGAMKQQKQTKRERKIGGQKASNGGVADWTSADSTLVLQLIAAMAYTGGALRFGYTRDGGAYAIGVYGDGDPYTLYITPKEDLNEALKDLMGDVAQAFSDR